jgi:hypothetical protein
VRNFDAGLAAELAKSAYRFFNAVEFQFTTPAYYTDFQYPLYIGGNKYEPIGMKIGSIATAAIMSADKVTLEIDDTNLGISAILLNEDARNKAAVITFGAVGSDFQIIASAEMFRGFIDGWELKEPTAEITIVNEFILWRKKTLRTAQATCPWLFKGTECTYAGAETWCDRSYERCQTLSNDANFGGFRFLPSIMDKEIWWGRIPK